jgi:DHA2 family multidrug resistance protein
LMGYSVVATGLVMAPFGIGTFLSILLVGRIAHRIDGRLLMAAGLIMISIAAFRMSGMSLQMDKNVVLSAGLLQGSGLGFVFVPMSTLAFATLSPHFRNDGAAMFTLIRNLGSGAGIALLGVLSYRNTETVNARLVEGLRPDNPVVAAMPSHFSLTDPAGVAALAGEVQRQALMVSYTDAFWLLGVLAISALGLILLLRAPQKGAQAVAVHIE